VGTGNGDPEVPELPSVQGYSWATLCPGDINTEAWSSRLGVGHEADNPIRESSKGKKILEEAKAPWAVVPLMMMIIIPSFDAI
jgi:hypothetical protein